MMIQDRDNMKIMFVCDHCPKMPKKSISMKTLLIQELADAAKKNGWFLKFMRGETEPNKRWKQCCPDCVAKAHNIGTYEALEAIAAPDYARAFADLPYIDTGAVNDSRA